jgi:hypothetical protein
VSEKHQPVFFCYCSYLVTAVTGSAARTAIFTVGFLGGAGAGIIFLLSPSGALPDGLSQPITLFENVLLEINRGYVDKVDENKLFETVSPVRRGPCPQSLKPSLKGPQWLPPHMGPGLAKGRAACALLEASKPPDMQLTPPEGGGEHPNHRLSDPCGHAT